MFAFSNAKIINKNCYLASRELIISRQVGNWYDANENIAGHSSSPSVGYAIIMLMFPFYVC